MKYKFHPEALDEYLGAIRFYCDVDATLGEAFVDEIEDGILQILSHPEAWQCLDGDVRRCLLKRFPFGIYYSIEDQMILIYAVMHMSRRPDYWRDRIG